MAESLLHALRKRQRIDGIADFHQGEVFHPGSGVAVYDPDFSNPVCSLIGGATAVGNSPSPLQPTPIYIPRPMGLVTGVRAELGDFEHSELTEL